MNLIEDQWIRCVRQRDGFPSLIAPHEITQSIDGPDPITDVIADRPDFKGALYQLLIGLLQTIDPPKNEKEWIALWRTPPSPEELKTKFDSMAYAFDLDVEGPAFMQDYDLPQGSPKPISALLIEAPGEKTQRDNLDHFVKRGRVETVCYPCAALALFTMQTNAPAGGSGQRVGLRGGGPLTTLVELDETFGDTNQRPQTLWHKLWLNVLPEKELRSGIDENQYNWDAADQSLIFPWLGPTRTSERNTGCDTLPENGHPYQMYWGMPRRIRIDFHNTKHGKCDLCGTVTNPVVSGFITKNNGINYTGIWEHPLTPYSRKSLADDPLPLHGQKGGVTYRNWLGLTLGDQNKCQLPATVVEYFISKRVRRLGMDRQARIWVFGYDLDKMKARCWYDSKMPLYEVDPSIRETLKDLVSIYIEAAVEMASNLKKEIKNARYKRPKDAKGDWAFIDIAFWQTTEGRFYDTIGAAITALKKNEGMKDIRIKSHKELKRSAMALFDEHVLGGPPADMDMERLVTARRNLSIWLQTGRKVRELIGNA